MSSPELCGSNDLPLFLPPDSFGSWNRSFEVFSAPWGSNGNIDSSIPISTDSRIPPFGLLSMPSWLLGCSARLLLSSSNVTFSSIVNISSSMLFLSESSQTWTLNDATKLDSISSSLLSMSNASSDKTSFSEPFSTSSSTEIRNKTNTSVGDICTMLKQPYNV